MEHDDDPAARTWQCSLVHELDRSEAATRERARLLARRLGDVQPTSVLDELAAHAEVSLAELAALAPPADGRRLGLVLSALRDHLLDGLLDLEHAYRAVLLGAHRGLDLVQLLQPLARARQELDLADWCGRWLDRRRPLVDEAARNLEWFAGDPARAREPTTRLAHGLRSLANRLEGAAGRLHLRT